MLNVDLVQCMELDQKINGDSAFTFNDLEVLNRVQGKRNWVAVRGGFIVGFLMSEVVPEGNVIDIYKVVSEEKTVFSMLVDKMGSQRSEPTRHMEAVMAVEQDNFQELSVLSKLGFRACSTIGEFYIMKHTHIKEHVEWMSENRCLKFMPRSEGDWDPNIPF